MALLKKLTKKYGESSFHEAINMVGEAKLDDFCDRIYLGFCKEYENAGYIKNVEWVLRHYFASKKMTLSALFYTQTEELNGKCLKNLTFYTCYYSIFNALLSNLILTSSLKLDQVRQISHSKVFSYIENYFIRFGIYDVELIDLLNELRLTRELYSYHLPLGGSIVREGENLNADVMFLRLSEKIKPILQISDILSYMSHFAWEKKVGKSFDEYAAHQEEIDAMFFSFIEHHDHLGKHCIIDDEDYRRQGYVLRKWNTPFPIGWFITEKMCEDLECGWEECETDDGFDISNVGRFLSRVTSAI
ncbi:hypothetical protein [Janthinobacterium sp. 13]|uniref:hypothetical protein n=1 Tax=Janthinobacterium sp. 13 TaxID=2035211 RepID=UPI000C399152|nr:hypothetical protein [Janthinobacterium sp. 13]PIF09464.1 hypothetical protein CLU94_1464 [Janthinobacterium sp. 13]